MLHGELFQEVKREHVQSWPRVWSNRTLPRTAMVTWYNHFGNVLEFLVELSSPIHFSCDSVVVFLAIYPREIKTYVECPQKEMFTRVFLAAGFMITPNWK